jgi:hypothetical protein
MRSLARLWWHLIGGRISGWMLLLTIAEAQGQGV